MPLTHGSRLVSFDAEAALAAALEADEANVRICAEYNIDDWELLYVADHVLEEYDDGVDDLGTRGDDLHSYIHLDFTERELFEDLAPRAGAVIAYVTRMEERSLVRFLSGREGLFLSLERDVALNRVMDAVETVIY